MPYFAVYALDKQGMASTRAKLRPSHRARLVDHDHPVAFHVGGPMLDDQGEMIGSLLIAEAESADAVRAFLAGDPYVANGLYESIDIRPFAWGLGRPETDQEPKNG